MAISHFFSTPAFLVLVIALSIWEIAWRGLATWKAAKNKHKKWFWGLLILNTVGILPIFYLFFFSKRRKK